MKKILITGSNGLLGQKLIEKLLPENYFVIATSKNKDRSNITHPNYIYEELDITNFDNIKNIFEKYLPGIIINTAATTNVDACELNPYECYMQNTKSVELMTNTLQNLQNNNYTPHFIHLSTDFIFDGTKKMLTEEDVPNPLSIYAKSKLEAEKIIQQSNLSKWAIVRTILVYGVAKNMSRTNIVLWIKQSLEQNKTISIVTDQFRTPTLAEDLADGCILIAQKGATGIFNIAGKDLMSIYEMACRVADFFHLDKSLIRPSLSDDIKQPAKRPPVTGLDISKARKILGYEPHSFEEGLHIVQQQLLKNHNNA
ncbi:MAG: NAD(P)-dependent oxidoreductase [Bacteroidia bacterium]|nr:MAG: NAD(P)-dependent oxidoreductase [Bacteroidia bacterium]